MLFTVCLFQEKEIEQKTVQNELTKETYSKLTKLQFEQLCTGCALAAAGKNVEEMVFMLMEPDKLHVEQPDPSGRNGAVGSAGITATCPVRGFQPGTVLSEAVIQLVWARLEMMKLEKEREECLQERAGSRCRETGSKRSCRSETVGFG